MTTTQTVTADCAWLKDKDAQARLREGVARDLGLHISEVERAYRHFRVPAMWPAHADYRTAFRDALVADAPARRARYDVRRAKYEARLDARLAKRAREL
jgi:hypothetical protein